MATRLGLRGRLVTDSPSRSGTYAITQHGACPQRAGTASDRPLAGRPARARHRACDAARSPQKGGGSNSSLVELRNHYREVTIQPNGRRARNSVGSVILNAVKNRLER